MHNITQYASLDYSDLEVPTVMIKQLAADQLYGYVTLYSSSITMDNSNAETLGEVYFLSHGGPPSMYDTQSKTYEGWKKFGRLVNKSNPKGLVIVSAHWENESGSSGVQINTDLSNPLIYDFYGFPGHYYKEKFHSRGSPELLKDTIDVLKAGGVDVEPVARGPDHGVWVPLKVAFNDETDIPLVQVSLPGDSSTDSTIKLGKALSALRKKGYAIVASGQIVHNLRDYMNRAPTPYSGPFLKAVSAAITSTEPLQAIEGMFQHPLYKRAHPTPEHFLPILVSVGASDGGDRLKTIYTEVDKYGLAWGMWKWAKV